MYTWSLCTRRSLLLIDKDFWDVYTSFLYVYTFYWQISKNMCVMFMSCVYVLFGTWWTLSLVDRDFWRAYTFLLYVYTCYRQISKSLYVMFLACLHGLLGTRRSRWLVVKESRREGVHAIGTGWRRLIGSPKLQIIFHKRATKYTLILRKMTYKDKGSYESSAPCTDFLPAHTSLLYLYASHWQISKNI